MWYPFTGSSPDIGAYESGATSNVSPVVNLTSPTNNASFYNRINSNNQFTATDSDGYQVARQWNFSSATKIAKTLPALIGFAWVSVPVGNFS